MPPRKNAPARAYVWRQLFLLHATPVTSLHVAHFSSLRGTIGWLHARTNAAIASCPTPPALYLTPLALTPYAS